MTPVERFKPYLEPIPADVVALDASRELEYADDSVLLSLARRGSEPAMAALFVRYRQSAEHYARYLGMSAEAPDVVSETFAQILDLISRGKGPEKAFRAYLLTSVRHEAGRRAKARLKVVTTGDAEDLDQPVEFGGGELSVFERGVVQNAYASLPSRWRAVLWELDVEGRSPQEVAERHGMKANAVSALAYRARAGLRESYLQQHVSSAIDPLCKPVRKTMASVVRGTAQQRVRERVLLHLDSCDRCVDDFNELTAFNKELGAIRGPAVAAAGAGAATVGWWSGAFGWLSAAKGTVAAAIVPVAAVGALAVAPSFVDHDPMARVGDAAISKLESDQLPELADRLAAAATAREVSAIFAPTTVTAPIVQGATDDGASTDPLSAAGRLVSEVLAPIHEQVVRPIVDGAGQTLAGVLGGVGHLVNEVTRDRSSETSGGNPAASSSTTSPGPTKKVKSQQGPESRHEDEVADSPK